MKFFNARRNAYHTNPKQIDEVIYTPYIYDPPSNPHESRPSRAAPHAPVGDLLGIPELREDQSEERPVKQRKRSKFDTTATEAEIFLFDYGTVVIWGMTEQQERRFLSSMCVLLIIQCTKLTVCSENASKWINLVWHFSPEHPFYRNLQELSS